MKPWDVWDALFEGKPIWFCVAFPLFIMGGGALGATLIMVITNRIHDREERRLRAEVERRRRAGLFKPDDE